MTETVPLEYKLEHEKAPPIMESVPAVIAPVLCNPTQLTDPDESRFPHSKVLVSSIDMAAARREKRRGEDLAGGRGSAGSSRSQVQV